MADKLIVALDVDSLEKAENLVQVLIPKVKIFKVGAQLFTSVGPAAVGTVQRLGGKAFLDLKFHDIPNTVAQAAVAATRLGVWAFNLHIQGGMAMLKTALEASRKEAEKLKITPPLILGVTALTSLAEKELLDLGVSRDVKGQVVTLAKLARASGLDGVIASPREAQFIRWTCGEKFVIITPGVRPAWAQEKDDQKRVATPQEAIKFGADYIVVGRPVIEAADPLAAAEKVIQEISAA